MHFKRYHCYIYGGSNSTSSISLAAANLPSHSHVVGDHGHTIKTDQHTHSTDVDHAHNASANEHGHGINVHYHDIDDSNTSHTHNDTNTNMQHTHSTTEVTHKHTMSHNHSEVDAAHQHTYQVFKDWGVNDAQRGSKASNLVDSIEQRRVWNEVDTDDATYNSANQVAVAEESGDKVGITSVNVGIVSSMIADGSCNLTSTTTYGSLSTTSITCGNSASSKYSTSPSLNNATGIVTKSSDLATQFQNTSSALTHDISGVSGTHYGASFTFDNVNLSCIEIFYYIRAK